MVKYETYKRTRSLLETMLGVASLTAGIALIAGIVPLEVVAGAALMISGIAQVADAELSRWVEPK